MVQQSSDEELDESFEEEGEEELDEQSQSDEEDEVENKSASVSVKGETNPLMPNI